MKKENSLNPSQLAASETLGKPVLVIAGAGTGKTNTLVHRLLFLVNSGIDPSSLLLLTFTRRAAKEMLSRASGLLDKRMTQVSGGTFHSFCNFFLRKYSTLLGYPSNFSILDEEDSIQLTGMAREDVLGSKTKKRFPKRETLREIFSSSFNTQTSIEKILTKEYPQFLNDIKEIQTVKERYEILKKNNQSFDFDDLLDCTRKILMENETVRSRISKTYKHILVDEYQDTNKVQAHISCLMASIHENIMVVGDDAQCIYGFRGANVRNILDFPQIFPNTLKITLEENYRSSKPILNLANSALSKFKEKFDKNLFTQKTSPNRLPKLIQLKSQEEEASFVAEEVLKQNENGIPFREIAVLSRSGWHSNLIELEFNARKIPYKKYGGKKFLELAHIKDVLSYLRILHNPADSLSWNRVLHLEAGVGPKQSALFLQRWEKLPQAEVSFDLENEISFWIGFTEEAKQNILKLLNLLKQVSISENKKVTFAFESFLTHYLPILQREYDDPEKRTNDLDSLKLITKDASDLGEFLATLSLEPIESSYTGTDDPEEEGYVTLSTIHSAKGLEWKTVFLIQAIQGQLPSSRVKTWEELEEERRLFYVGITRAKEDLFLVCPLAEEKKSIQLQEVSRFISELENSKELLDWQEYHSEPDVSSSEKGENLGKTERFQQIQNYFLN
ncbi:ATP-dependent helicase [Leptospira idonii]|uniref:ATP-dependent helicase n=1 Tax=Leptospira idonii TaxID=1193500 RepID=UPI001FEC7B5A|nr:ATP-dependent helicase [Leptospira idonii]